MSSNKQFHKFMLPGDTKKFYKISLASSGGGNNGGKRKTNIRRRKSKQSNYTKKKRIQTKKYVNRKRK